MLLSIFRTCLILIHPRKNNTGIQNKRRKIIIDLLLARMLFMENCVLMGKSLIQLSPTVGKTEQIAVREWVFIKSVLSGGRVLDKMRFDFFSCDSCKPSGLLVKKRGEQDLIKFRVVFCLFKIFNIDNISNELAFGLNPRIFSLI